MLSCATSRGTRALSLDIHIPASRASEASHSSHVLRPTNPWTDRAATVTVSPSRTNDRCPKLNLANLYSSRQTRVCVCFIIHDYRKEIARKQAKIHKVKNCYRCYRKPVEFLVKFNSHNYFSAFSPTIGRRTHTYPCFRCVYLCSSESLSLFASCQFFFLLVSCLDFFEPLLTADCWEPVPEIKLY